MNDFYVVEFTTDINTYREGQRIIAWKFSDRQYVVANSDMEYIMANRVKEVYRVKFEEIGVV